MPNYPFDDDDEGQEPQNENASFQELRNHAKALEKQVKQSTKELEELRQFRADAERQAKVATAKRAGLTEKQADAFLRSYEGEVSGESVRAWADSLGIPLSEGAPQEQEDSPERQEVQRPDPGFSPTSFGGTQPVKNRLTYEQYQQLLALDFPAAAKAIADGRVDGLYQNPE